MIKKILIILTVTLIVSCNSDNKLDFQNFEVYPTKGQYVVRGAVDQKKHYQSEHADEAIQWAADQLYDGGEVFLHKGNYFLKDEISLPSYVSIKGSGMGSVFIIDPDHKTGVGFNIEGKNRVLLKDFAVKSVKSDNNSKTGIIFDDCGDCLIDGVYIAGMKENGILFINNTFLSEVTNSRISACEGSAIRFENLDVQGRGGDFVPNNISNCIIYHGNYGITCSNAIVVNISDVTVYQSNNVAFHLMKKSNSVLITGCRTYQIQNDAVVVEDSHEINISSNIFCWTEGHGIVLNEVKWGTVSANNVIDNGSLNPFDPIKDSLRTTEEVKRTLKSPDHRKSIKSGIVLKNNTQGVTITGNAVFNWPATPKMKYGIVEDETCENNNIISNNINFYSIADVHSEGKGTKVMGNVGFGEIPYTGNIGVAGIQAFNIELMEDFIDDFWN